MIGITNSNTSTIYVGPTEPTSGVRIWLDTDEEGASAVNSVNGHNGVVVLDPDDVGAMAKWQLVWTNASPSSSFAAQTVSVDLSGFDLVAIEYCYQNTQLTRCYVVFCFSLGYMIEWFAISSLSGSGAKYAYTRRSTVNSTGVTFEACYNAATNSTSAGSAANDHGIPIYIYGSKGVQTS